MVTGKKFRIWIILVEFEKKMVEMRNLFGTIARSTSAPAGYDQIDDTSEGRLKVHAEEAFKAGIKFKARFIGSLEIPKVPNQIILSWIATNLWF